MSWELPLVENHALDCAWPGEQTEETFELIKEESYFFHPLNLTIPNINKVKDRHWDVHLRLGLSEERGGQAQGLLDFLIFTATFQSVYGGTCSVVPSES